MDGIPKFIDESMLFNWNESDLFDYALEYSFRGKVSQTCDEILVACRYGGIDYDCMDIFEKILTDEGLCCIFNGVDRNFLMKSEYRWETIWSQETSEDLW